MLENEKSLIGRCIHDSWPLRDLYIQATRPAVLPALVSPSIDEVKECRLRGGVYGQQARIIRDVVLRIKALEAFTCRDQQVFCSLDGIYVTTSDVPRLYLERRDFV